MGLRSWFVRRLVKRVSAEVVAISQTEKKCLAFRGSLQSRGQGPIRFPVRPHGLDSSRATTGFQDLNSADA